MEGRSSMVDTSRPFSSVREAIAIFGEGLLLSPSPIKPQPTSTIPISSSISNNNHHHKQLEEEEEEEEEEKEKSISSNNGEGDNIGMLLGTIKKVEAELEKTKEEVKGLKERGSETEVALATLNAELHKNMSKLAQAEAVAAGNKAAMATKTVRFDFDIQKTDQSDEETRIVPLQQHNKTKIMDYYSQSHSHSHSHTLAHIMSLGENDKYLFGGKKQRKNNNNTRSMKIKPIIPLVGDFLFKIRKSSPTTHHNPLFASPF